MASPTSSTVLQAAFLLHHRPYRESSLLVEIFTADSGRLGLVAKGVRGGRKGSGALLQPFQPLLLSWTQRGELGTLTGVEARERAIALRGPALFSGFYLNELMMRLLERHDPHPELFASYETTLHALLEPTVGEWALRLFERDLLQGLGYGLLLEQTADGEPIQPQGSYCYHLEQGPLIRENSEPCLAIGGATLLALASGALPEPSARGEAKHLMRAALGLYLGTKPLQSRELFRHGITAGLFGVATETNLEE